MSELLDLVFEAIGAILAHPAVGMAVRLGVMYLGIVWLAAAWWAYRDAQKRTRSPIAPYAAAGSMILLTPFLFPLAVVVWRVLRPGLTLAEERAGRLQRDLLVDDATRDACPGCGLAVDAGWVRCPACREALATPCPACGRNAAWDWTICAWCASELTGRDDQDPVPGRDPLVAATATAARQTPAAGARVAVGPGRRSATPPQPTLVRD